MTYEERSRATLDRALQECPFYEAWRVFDPGPTAGVEARYAALPVLTKADIRRHFPDGFVPRGLDWRRALAAGDLELVQTSGSTAEQVTNFWDQRWWDASEQASWPIHPATRQWATGRHREAILASSRSVGPVSDGPDLSLHDRRLGRFLFLNEKTDPGLWQEHHVHRMLRELADYRPEVLEANPSYLWRLCRFAHERGLAVAPPRVVVLTFERPLAHHLHWIRLALDCPLVSSYGSTELGYVFMQCGQGRFHQNSGYCRVDFETLPGQPDARLGRILVTTFHHPFCQILRFDPGDVVRLAVGSCTCGRYDGLTVEDIEGRRTQITRALDGRLVTLRQLDSALAGLLGPEPYELEQVSAGDFFLRVETPAPERSIVDGLRRLYGPDARIVLERVPRIPPGPSGKFRHVFSRQPLEKAVSV